MRSNPTSLPYLLHSLTLPTEKESRIVRLEYFFTAKDYILGIFAFQYNNWAFHSKYTMKGLESHLTILHDKIRAWVQLFG